MPTADSIVKNQFPSALLLPLRKVMAAALPGFVASGLPKEKTRQLMVEAVDQALIAQYPVAQVLPAKLRKRVIRQQLDFVLDEWFFPKEKAEMTAMAAASPVKEKISSENLGSGFDGFVIQVKKTKSPRPAAMRAVKRALGAGWTVSKFWNNPLEFEVNSPAASFSRPEAWDAVYRLREQPEINRAEVSFIVPASQIPETKLANFKAASGIFSPKHLPESGDCEWSVKQIKAKEAWHFASQNGKKSRGEGILVGHPDTGYTEHYEIWSKRLLVNKGYDFWRDDRNPTDDLDDGWACGWEAKFKCFPGHGTGTASVIMSDEGSNGPTEFVTGIAPMAELIPFRVAPTVVLFSPKRLAQAIHQAVDSGCHVISISMGGLGAGYLHEAVKRAVDHGVIVCCAAGNYWPWVVWPAAYPEAIAVAATNAAKKPWKDSASGEAVALSAPGESVWRASAVDRNVSRSSGTSFAVAATAGVACLWLAHHGRDQLLKDIGRTKIAGFFKSILTTEGFDSQPNWETKSYGKGILNAEKVLRASVSAVSRPAAAKAALLSARNQAGTPTPFEQLQNIFPELTTADLKKGLGGLLKTPPAKLSEKLTEVGDELAFHFVQDPNERERFIEEITVTKSPQAARVTSLKSGKPVPSTTSRLQSVASGRLATLMAEK